MHSEPEPRPAGWLHHRWIDLYGWAGVAAVVVAYCLMAVGWIGPGAVFYGSNLVGSIGIALVAYRDAAWQPFWLNVIFAAFAVVGLAVYLVP